MLFGPKILSIIMVTIALSFYSVAAFAESFSGKDVMDMSKDLAYKIEATNGLPEGIQMPSAEKMIKIENTLYLMAKWLDLYAQADKTIPNEVPLLEVERPAKTKDGVTSGQVNLENLFKAGHDVAAILEANSKMPPSFNVMWTDTGNTTEAEVGPVNLIYIFARTIRWVAEHDGVMPNYTSVRRTTPPQSWIRPEFSVKEGFISYSSDRFSDHSRAGTEVAGAVKVPDTVSIKLGLNYLSRNLSAYYPYMVSRDNRDLKWDERDPDDRWDIKYRLPNLGIRATNNYNGFDGISQDPFYVIANPFSSDNPNYHFYKLTTQVFGTSLQFQKDTTPNQKYFLTSATYSLGDYKLYAIYGDRVSVANSEDFSQNVVSWLQGPAPGFSRGTVSVGYMHSDSNLIKYSDFSGDDDGYRIGLKDAGLGRFSFDAIHLNMGRKLIPFWAPGVESYDFVGTGRLYNYGSVSTNTRLLSQNVKVSLSGSNDQNEVAGSSPFLANKMPSEEVKSKLQLDFQPEASLKYYVSGQYSEAFAKKANYQKVLSDNLQASNHQLAAGIQKDYAKFRWNLDGAYNEGFIYDRDSNAFKEPNWWLYTKLENSKHPLDPTFAAYYEMDRDSGPTDLRAYARIRGNINNNWYTNVAYLHCWESYNPSWDGFYQYYGIVYTYGGFKINTGYLYRSNWRFYCDVSQKIRSLALQFTYGYKNGLGDGSSRDHSIDDNRPWEALMGDGSYRYGTSPEYTLKLKMQL